MDFDPRPLGLFPIQALAGLGEIGTEFGRTGLTGTNQRSDHHEFARTVSHQAFRSQCSQFASHLVPSYRATDLASDHKTDPGGLVRVTGGDMQHQPGSASSSPTPDHVSKLAATPHSVRRRQHRGLRQTAGRAPCGGARR